MNNFNYASFQKGYKTLVNKLISYKRSLNYFENIQ